MAELVLSGCRPTPLASYLKALGIFRLVAEQEDPNAKCCWRGDRFVLRTSLDEESLSSFFVDRYIPTPIMSPWNGQSGFYPGDNMEAINAILQDTGDRLDRFRAAIHAVRDLPEMPPSFETIRDVLDCLVIAIAESRPGKQRTAMEKLISDAANAQVAAADRLNTSDPDRLSLHYLEAQAKSLKGPDKRVVSKWWNAVKKVRTQCSKQSRSTSKVKVIASCRANLGGDVLFWIDSAVALCADGSPAYNPLLGSGGNDGKLEFSKHFQRHVVDMLLETKRKTVSQLLSAALFAEPVAGYLKAPIGQYDPGRAGGFNQGSGIEHKGIHINPWDFVLMLEGSTLFTSAVVRRSSPGGSSLASIPFTVRFSGVGFNSSDPLEGGRSELWLPTWPRFTGLSEINYLFHEGRSSLGQRPAKTGIDFTRAVKTLGVDRGLDSFVRFAFLERRGKNYVALPAGRFRVQHSPAVRLLDELDPIIERRLDPFLRQFLGDVPATFQRARRVLDESIFACANSPAPRRFLSLLRAIGRIEALVAQRDRSKKPKLNRPLIGLSGSWILEADDGRTEIRLAAALASIMSTGGVGPLRCNLAGVDAARPWVWAQSGSQQCWYGSNVAERLGNVLHRRLMDGKRLGAPHAPLDSRLSVDPRDLVSFLHGETDDRLLEDLLWGLMTVDWRQDDLGTLRERWRAPALEAPIPRSYALMKLVVHPRPIRRVSVRSEPRVVGLLRAGRLSEACRLATHRLRISDLKPLPVAYQDEIDPTRALAALMVPIRRLGLLESLVLNNDNRDETRKER